MITLLLAVLVVGLLIYHFLIKPQTYWRSIHVKQGAAVPFFGDNFFAFFRLESFADLVKRVYHRDPNGRYTGLYQMTTPTLMMRDPELIKQITVKDFDHFMDHRSFVPETIDPFWAKNLFALRGEKWKDMRATLSPSFTATKMRAMFSLMDETAQQFIDYYDQQPDKQFELEMKDSFTRYANDVIANCAFGVKCDSLKERDNEFYLNGKEATDFSRLERILKIFTYILAPKLGKLMQLRLFSKRVAGFFTKIVTDSIKLREEQNIVRPDMINLLMEARKGGLKYEEEQNAKDAGFATVTESHIGKSHKHAKMELTDIDITAQALIFFFAGFDTVSTAMSFITYELAVNPEIQDKLREEVLRTHEACKGKLTYDSLASMKYMDMVISEGLRKWPPAIAIDRICTKPYTIQPVEPHERPVQLRENDVLWLPIFALHYDPNHFPNPDKFDPERFNEENKHNINPYTYVPFGSGPRNCIGSRFALMEVKVVLFHILTKFDINVTAKTHIPMKISKKQFNIAAEDGLYLEFKKRF